MFNMLILTLTPKKMHNWQKKTSYVQNKIRKLMLEIRLESMQQTEF